MAFQGNKGPDLVSLALNLMQMRREREFDERRLALEEFKAQEAARQNALQAARDQTLFDLDVKQRQAELSDAGVKLDSTMNEKEAGMGGLFELVNNPMAAEGERYAAGRAIDQFVQGQVKSFDRNPTQVGANMGAGLGMAMQNERKAEAVKESDAERDFRFSEKSAENDLRRTNRLEELRAKRDAELAKTEGLFNGEAMRNTRQIFATELEPAKATEKAWNFYNKFDPKNRQQVVDAVQLAQRAIDPVNVTEGDMRIRIAAGLDSQEALINRFEEWKTGKIAIPPELGPLIKENLREKLESADDIHLMTINSQDDYIKANGFDDAQRNFVIQGTEFRDRIRKRVASRAAPAVGASQGKPAIGAQPRRVKGKAAAALGLK